MNLRQILSQPRMHSSRVRAVCFSSRLREGVCPGGGMPGGGWCLSSSNVDRMTDMCKNITLPQLRC